MDEEEYKRQAHNEYNRNYRNLNKIAYNSYHKQYKAEHKETIKIADARYYARRSQPYHCPCGVTIVACARARHETTKKHRVSLAKLT